MTHTPKKQHFSLKLLVAGRVYVFIDAANILYSQQTLGWRVDYTKLRDYLKGECILKGLHIYTGHVGDNMKQRKFLEKLRRLGYQVRAKEIKRIRVAPGTYLLKGNLDVELAIDAVMHLSQYDTMILMSGDSDFAYLLDVVKACGKRVLVISTRGHVSVELVQRAKYINLQKLRGYLEYTAPPQKKSHPRRSGGRSDKKKYNKS